MFIKPIRPGGHWGPIALAVLALVVGLQVASPGRARAADLDVQASVDRTRVAVRDMVTLTVTVSSEGLGSPPTPELSAPDGFDILGSSSSTSTSIRIVNGDVSQTLTTSFVYTLRALREGSFVIGPARVRHQGTTHDSSPIRMEVTKASGRRRAQPAPAPGQTLSAQELRQIEENLYVAAVPDKKSVYVGEQLTVSYKLYTRYDLRDIAFGSVPTYTGFWAETLYDAKRVDMKREVVDGRAFNTLLLKVVALFPTSSGRQALEQLEMICSIPVRSRRRSLFDFDDFFSTDPFGTSKKVTVRSEDLVVEVLPLPPGAPTGYSGAVGRFTLSASATPLAIAAGDPVAVKAVVTGRGNLNSVREPLRPDAVGLRFYDPKVGLEKQPSGNRFGGRKTFEYVVIPEDDGVAEIAPFRLPYFDPENGRYHVVQSEPIPLQVTPQARASQPLPVASMLNREEIRVLGEDIRFIKPDRTVLEDQGRMLYADWRFLALQLVPVLGFFSMLGYRRHRDRLIGDVAYARRRRSRGEARRRLSQARSLMKDGDDKAFHAEIHRALAQFLADRLNLPAAGMAADAAARTLGARGVAPETVSEVCEVFQRCDFARFSPSRAPEGDMARLYQDTERLIDALGRTV
ncbi:MAG: BatD family protein [Candidatus Latescibacteria bacterium]|jgi:hypothetical protein|nr:BatD family protein [Candidatus Latescibacterota bacterium]